MSKKFKPAFGLKNRHTQTLYSSLFRKISQPNVEIEKFELSDGDFLEPYWHNKPDSKSQTPIVILFHGLAGSFDSPYIQGAMIELAKHGFASVIMHFRGCAKEENLLPRSYHSGETGDALTWIDSLSKCYPNSKLFAVGYSLGGNMLLKLLGEQRSKVPLTAAISVSAPLELDTCANAMMQGFSKLYQHILLKDLNISLEKKFQKFDTKSLLTIEKKDIKNLNTFWKFDEAYTAPVHGFTSAQDYYTKCSAKQFLRSIKIPTLIIHSSDDPFMNKSIIPKENELSQTTELELYPYGGHVGFIGGSFFKPEYWLEKRISSYFDMLK